MKKKLLIKGMGCQHCVVHVASVLKELEGIEKVEVNLKGKYSVVELSEDAVDIDETIFREAIEDAGYELLGVEEL